MAPRFFKKLKPMVKDLVSKMSRALGDSRSDSIRVQSRASPATQQNRDAKARTRLPATVSATERMILDG